MNEGCHGVVVASLIPTIGDRYQTSATELCLTVLAGVRHLAAFIHRASSSLPLSGKSEALNKVCYKGQ